MVHGSNSVVVWGAVGEVGRYQCRRFYDAGQRGANFMGNANPVVLPSVTFPTTDL